MDATSKRAFEKNARFASRGELCSTLGEVEKRHDGVFQQPARIASPDARKDRGDLKAGIQTMVELLTFSSFLAVVALSALEIVLGVDNLVFIAILTGRLPEHQRALGRKLGLSLAAVGRIVLLFAASWVMTLDATKLLTVGEWEMSIRDLILVAGGLFLLAKATWEIHKNLEGEIRHEGSSGKTNRASLGNVIGLILLLDLVFSIDSVLTAVGMVQPEKFASASIPGTTIPWPAMVIMASAVLSAVAVMVWFINPVSNFIERRPTVKMLALAFLLLIGVVLVAEGFGQHIPRGYIYFAMGFSLFVEMLNLRMNRKLLASSGAKSH
jgi:predicted tellurium resistance membrane protein TerC